MDDTASTNPERHTRILDAADTLFLHYGFDKTTVSDVAAAAGVSKGAIYLHFNSKDELFEALLFREMQKYSQIWVAAVMADPQGGTLGSLYKHVLSALNAVPFMAVIFKQDVRVLGNYLRKPNNIFVSMRAQGMRAEFIEQMQQAGAVRADVDAATLAQVMDILAYGFVYASENATAENPPSFEAIFELIGDMMDRAFTPPGGGNVEAAKAILRQITQDAEATFFNQASTDQIDAGQSEAEKGN